MGVPGYVFCNPVFAILQQPKPWLAYPAAQVWRLGTFCSLFRCHWLKSIIFYVKSTIIRIYRCQTISDSFPFILAEFDRSRVVRSLSPRRTAPTWATPMWSWRPWARAVPSWARWSLRKPCRRAMARWGAQLVKPVLSIETYWEDVWL